MAATAKENIDHFNEWWSVEPPTLAAADSEIQCPEDRNGCGEWSPVSEWLESEPYCEDCGSHNGIRCPRCGEDFDHVWGSQEPFRARTLQESAVQE